MNLNFYKLFNPELKFMNNTQLINHWKFNGSKNGLLCSIESFLKKYSYFNNIEYKLYNPDILINDNIELMVHWNLYGLKENRFCSNEYFNTLYPEFNINDLNHNNNESIQGMM